MAKPTIPGQVKTRLIGTLSACEAAFIHAAMLECVLNRSSNFIGEKSDKCLVLALDMTVPCRVGEDPFGFHLPKGWQVIDQGRGDLGQRLQCVWQQVDEGPTVFLGADSPDVPQDSLKQILPALERADAAIGRVMDGGYWTMATRQMVPALVRGIDWGSERVHDQTRRAAKQAGLLIADLDPWYDVDTISDLDALRSRLDQIFNSRSEPALAQLSESLDQVCKGKK